MHLKTSTQPNMCVLGCSTQKCQETRNESVKTDTELANHVIFYWGNKQTQERKEIKPAADENTEKKTYKNKTIDVL